MKYPSLNNIGYLFDEWSSYCSNITLNLQLEKIGTPEPEGEGHAANYSPHFFGYLAIAMQYLLVNEPEAVRNRQFKAAFALYSEITWDMMTKALKSPVFGDPNTIYGSRLSQIMNFYRNSSKFAQTRTSLATIYGKDWVQRLMRVRTD